VGTAAPGCPAEQSSTIFLSRRRTYSTKELQELRAGDVALNYSVRVRDEEHAGDSAEAKRALVGLCSDCRFMRLVESDRGSRFYLCELSATNPAFPKYPRLPVLQCTGYERLGVAGETPRT
jgi:hypothetical protein